jgi:hypothetical protein
LQRRSKLPVENPAHVLAASVESLKTGKKGTDPAPKAVGTNGGAPTSKMMSRSAYERTRNTSTTGNEKADKTDPGMVDCTELWAVVVPSDYDLHEGTEATLFQFVVGGGQILSVNESTYQHGMFPYSAAEARPCHHFQFSPSWAYMLKGLQDYIDWLKNRHQEALARTVGNVFIADPTKVDLDDFLDPDKEGCSLRSSPLRLGRRSVKLSRKFRSRI